MVNKALNAVARFMAALTGKSYAVQAVGVMEDYAGSIEDVGSADVYKRQIIFDGKEMLWLVIIRLRGVLTRVSTNR